jgi:hypothetical protein
MEAPTCDVRAMVLAVPIIPLPSAAAFPASGAWLCWSLENCTGSERDRPRRHVLICRFAAGPDEPQPGRKRRRNGTANEAGIRILKQRHGSR